MRKDHRVARDRPADAIVPGLAPGMRTVEQIPPHERRIPRPPALGEEPWIHPTARVLDAHLGAWTEIGAFARLEACSLDDYSYVAGSHVDIINAAVGKFCSIASAVRINPGQHPMERTTQHHCTYRRRQYGFADTDDEAVFARRRRNAVSVDHDVWIGHGAVITAGVTVGTGSVIGAGAVVTSHVEPYQVVIGVPARHLRYRFPPLVRERLLASAWWDWDHATLARRLPALADVDRFLEEYA